MAHERKIECSEKSEAIIKGIQTRKKYKLRRQKINVSYPAFVLSNEDLISNYGPKMDGSSVLVGTSCLRSVLIACELSTPRRLTKLIIIDNSRQVHVFWNAIRAIAQEDHLLFAEDIRQALFLSKFSNKLETLEIQTCSTNQAYQHMKQLFDKYGYNGVLKIIANIVLIKQNWIDTNTFKKLNNIFKKLEIKNVYVYSSNIVSYMALMSKDISVSDTILNNIQILHPTRSIHTDCVRVNPIGFAAVNTYVCDDSTPALVRKKINSFNSVPVLASQGVKFAAISFVSFLYLKTDLETLMKVAIVLVLMIYKLQQLFTSLQRDPSTSQWPGRTVSSTVFFSNKATLLPSTSRMRFPDFSETESKSSMPEFDSTNQYYFFNISPSQKAYIQGLQNVVSGKQILIEENGSVARFSLGWLKEVKKNNPKALEDLINQSGLSNDFLKNFSGP